MEVEAWRLHMMNAERSEAETAVRVAEQEREKVKADAEKITQETEAEKVAFRKQARQWVEREKTVLASKHEAANADRAQAAADLMTARSVLDELKDTYAAVRRLCPYPSNPDLGSRNRG